jgi:replicative DNA helicase
MGKTALMLNEAKYQAMQGIPVGIFSCEMSDKDLAARMLAEFCEIDSKKITHNKTTDFEKRLMEEKRPEFEKLPIYIHDQPAISPMELKLQASKWKRENGVKMIFVDYLQLMTANGKNNTGNREQEISSISRSLKATAKELEIPVMALSQLSRAVETRGGMKRPILSDLRESGAIEQDADLILFLLRAEYYKINEWDDDQRTPSKGTAEISIAKFRGGDTGSFLVGAQLQYMRFFNIDEHPWTSPSLPAQDPNDVFDDPQEYIPEEEDLPF